VSLSIEQPIGQERTISVDEIRRQASERTTSGTSPPPPRRELGKDAFLRLLTVQLKNQDPLEPIKNEAFVAQLAQFSSLEQLQNINTTLSAGNAGGATREGATLAAVGNNTAVSLIGKQVEVVKDTVDLAPSGSAQITYNLEGSADRMTADITDSAGRRVRTLTLHPSGLQGLMMWDGKSDDGVRVSPGAYRVALTAQAGSQPVKASSVALQEVTGVRTRDSAEPLLLFGGGSAPLSSVSGIFTRR
jgi:flagellar basal-body rod modification protein FlgD